MRKQLKRAVIGAFGMALGTAVPGVSQGPGDLNNQSQSRIGQGSSSSISDNGPSLSTADPVETIAKVLEPLQPDLAANPGRPAMATSALLTPLGYAQFENGMQYAMGSAEFNKRAGMEETMRVTVAPRLEFIFSAEPIAYSRMTGNNLAQRGDATAGLQVVAMKGLGVKPTLSLSFLRLVHGGSATNLDIGGYANSALLMGSLDLGRLHLDVNGFVNETEGSLRRAQTGEATAATLPLAPKLAATLELRFFTQPLTGGSGVGTLLAAGYSLRPNLAFDAGAVRGLSSTSTRWQVTSGFTYVLPRKVLGF